MTHIGSTKKEKIEKLFLFFYTLAARRKSFEKFRLGGSVSSTRKEGNSDGMWGEKREICRRKLAADGIGEELK